MRVNPSSKTLPVRRLAAVAAASVMLLAGCSSNGDATPTPGASSPSASPSGSPSASPSTPPKALAQDVAALAAVKTSGAAGKEPTTTLKTPFGTSTVLTRVEKQGTGAVMKAGQLATFHYVQLSGDDGKAVFSTWTESKPERLLLGDPGLLKELTDAFIGAKVGARILLALPAQAATEATETAAATQARPATLTIIDVTAAKDLPAKATGTAVKPPAGLPTVKLAANGAPSITVPTDATKPTKLVAQQLIKGTGPVVKKGQSLVVHYSGWTFDGKSFDSSWDRGSPFTTTIGTGQVIPGWDTGLVGQPVGSQVLLVVPPDQGYGDTAAGSIPAGSTLIFVVDILDAA